MSALSSHPDCAPDVGRAPARPGTVIICHSNSRGGCQPPCGVELVGEWIFPEGAAPSARCYRRRAEYWVVSENSGTIRFSRQNQTIHAYPAPGVETGVFEREVVSDWLPAIYAHWGWQVLHASGVLHSGGDRAVAFCGQSGSGKSTLAYALGLRPGWRHFADEAVAFALEDRKACVVPIANEVRLRRPTLEYFGLARRKRVPELVRPGENSALETIYFLEAHDGESIDILPVPGWEIFPQLLRHAFSLTLSDAQHKRQLSEAYLALGGFVPAFKLLFPRKFEVLNNVLEVLERHALDGAPR